MRIFKKTSKVRGHTLSAQGIGPDRDKTAAIAKVESPQNVPELRRFLGMINHQQKFIKNLSDKTSPLRDLLSSKIEWHWGPAQETAFQRLKNDMSQAPVLAHYCPEKDTIVSADASSYGLGAVLLQVQDDGSTKATAYASRSLTSTEQRYAQIEKEDLATKWACEKFADYILGKEFKIETDHKPLIPMLGSKCLQDLPPRIQRFRMRLMRYSYQTVHVPGKDLTTADILSRAPLHRRLTKEETKLNEELNLYVSHVIESLPATERRLQEVRSHQDEDEICLKLKEFCREGWPEKHKVNDALQPYWQCKGEITVQQGILMKADRVIIPSALRLEVLDTRASKSAGREQSAKCGGQDSADKLRNSLRSAPPV